MKILSSKSFSSSISPKHKLFGVVLGSSSSSTLSKGSNSGGSRTFYFCGKPRLLSLLQLLSLFMLICTLAVYTTLSSKTNHRNNHSDNNNDNNAVQFKMVLNQNKIKNNNCLFFFCDDGDDNAIDDDENENDGFVVDVIDIDAAGAAATTVKKASAGANYFNQPINNQDLQQHPQGQEVVVQSNELLLKKKKLKKKAINNVNYNNKKSSSHAKSKDNSSNNNLKLGKSANNAKDDLHLTVDSDSISSNSNSELYYDYNGPTQQHEQLDNVFFSVKSTKRFHTTRLDPILKTWFNLAKNQTWFFTDDDDPELAAKTNGHIVNTHCPPTHYRQALCCKMSAEFDTFIQTTKSWFCHFDDDNYVNVPALLNLLGRFSPREYWYLGKPSLKSPIRIKNPDNHTDEVSFWFATGGAGFCLSRALALRMSPLASGGKFMKACDKIQLPDDVTMGYIAGHLLGQNLTVIPQFHSHFETMKFVDTKNPSTEITFSYVRYAEYQNILDVDGLSEQDDPTRFLSLHCHLFPRSFSYCSSLKTTTTTTTITTDNEYYSAPNYYNK